MNYNNIELEDDPLGLEDTPIDFSYLYGENSLRFYKLYGTDPILNQFN